MADFRAKVPADGTTGTVDINRWNADTLVRQYATLCSLPVMQTAITQSVTNLTLTVDPNSGAVSVEKKK